MKKEETFIRFGEVYFRFDGFGITIGIWDQEDLVTLYLADMHKLHKFIRTKLVKTLMGKW